MTTRRKYVVLTKDFLEDMPEQWVREFRWLLEAHGGGLVPEYDTMSFILVDDLVPEDIKTYIAEMLEGHPFSIRELNIVPAPKGGFKPSQGRGTWTELGRQPSVRSMRRKP